jgi:hypothetical protein
MAFLVRQMIFDAIGDLLTDRRQRKQFGFYERIVGPLDEFPTRGRLIPQIGKPIMYAEHSTVELGAVTIHGGAFTRTPREADVGSESAGTTKSNFRLRRPQLHRHARPTAHKKIESSLLNGNLMVLAGHPSIFSSDGNAMEAESLET